MNTLTFPLIVVSAALAAVPPTCEGVPPIGTGGTGGGASCAAATDCAVGQACCAGRCASLQNDRENCGSCGARCADGAVCSAGRCVPDAGAACSGSSQCSAGQACCAGFCKSLQNDRENCGSCGARCADGAVCSAGRCVPDPGAACSGSSGCGAGQACCAGFCKSLLDPNNCGSCGASCAVGDVCTVQGCVRP